MKKGSTSDLGDKYIDLIEDQVAETKNLVVIKRTKGSGNIHGDGDLIIMHQNHTNNGILIDGKYTSNPITHKDLEKAVKQAAQTGREFGIVIRPSKSKLVNNIVEISLVDFLELLDN